MTTYAVGLVPSNATNADFRAWGSGVSAALAAVGLSKTTDTGQIDWTTVAAPVASNTYQGYEIWKLTDSLQTTAPFFMKLEYGSGNAAGTPSVRVTFGTGTNGAGTLTGFTTTAKQSPGTIGSTTTSYPCYFSSDGSYLNMVLFAGFSNAMLWMSAGRTRNTDGTANGDGLYTRFGAGGGNSNSVGQVLSTASGAGVQVSSTTLPRIPNDWTTGGSGSELAFFPITVYTPKLQASHLDALLYWSNDLPAGTSVSITHLGAAHTYMALGSWGAAADGGTTGSSAVLRYE